MCAVWLKLLTILCIYCAALIDAENKGVVWRNVGEAVTIQCRARQSQEYLSLRMGLNEEREVFFTESFTKNTVARGVTGRLQFNGVFPNVDVLIQNLTLNDTGPYWCVYKMFDEKKNTMKITKGEGSVLLVVTEDRRATTDAVQGCNSPDQSLVLVSVVVAAAVLFGLIIGFIIWLVLKTKRNTVKPRPVATNDVYEDMRGTLRR